MNLKLFLLLIAGHFVTDINGGALPALLPFVKESLNFSYTQTASIILVFNITSSVIQPVFGFFSDRWPSRWLLPLGPLIACLGLAFLGLGSSYMLIVLCASLSGLGHASYHPEGFKAAHLSSGHKKATAMSLFLVGGHLGIAVGPILATLIYTYFGLKGTLWFFLPGIAIATVFLATPHWISQESISPGQPKGGMASFSFGQSIFPMSLILMTVVLRSAARLSLLTFIPFYFVTVLNRSPLIAGKYLSIFLITGAIGAAVGGPLADRYGYKRYVLMTLGFSSLLLYLFLATEGLWSLILFGCAGFVLISSNSVTMAIGQSLMPRNLGMASGLILGLGMGLGGIITTGLGWVADRWGLPFALHLIFALPFLGMLFCIPLPYPLGSTDGPPTRP